MKGNRRLGAAAALLAGIVAAFALAPSLVGCVDQDESLRRFVAAFRGAHYALSDEARAEVDRFKAVYDVYADNPSDSRAMRQFEDAFMRVRADYLRPVPDSTLIDSAIEGVREANPPLKPGETPSMAVVEAGAACDGRLARPAFHLSRRRGLARDLRIDQRRVRRARNRDHDVRRGGQDRLADRRHAGLSGRLGVRRPDYPSRRAAGAWKDHPAGGQDHAGQTGHRHRADRAAWRSADVRRDRHAGRHQRRSRAFLGRRGFRLCSDRGVQRTYRRRTRSRHAADRTETRRRASRNRHRSPE